MEEFRLLIDTVDQKGLVYKISKILFEANLNIKENAEFVEKENNKFFMRSVIEGEFNKEKLINDLKQILPSQTSIKLTSNQKKDIVILVTKENHCLGDLLIRYESGELNANIKCVIANHNNLKNLVKKFGIEYVYISHENISRSEHEKLITQQINKYNPDIIVLAKYMRILTPDFVAKYPLKMLNIHHSFLPAFIGANPYKQAYQRGVKIIGATAHFVTNDLDEGPIIEQDIVRVDHTYSWQDMQKAGRNIEKIVLAKALNLILEDKVFVYNNKTIIL